MRITERFEGKQSLVLVTADDKKQYVQLTRDTSFLSLKNGVIIGWSGVYPNPQNFGRVNGFANAYPYDPEVAKNTRAAK